VDAFTAQSRVIVDWYAAANADELAAPTILPGWTVGDLGAHLVVAWRGLVTGLDSPSRERPQTQAEYVARYAAAADQVAEGARQAQVGDLAEAHDGAMARLAQAWPDVVHGSRGPIRSDDFVASRLVDLVVHVDDLTRSQPRPAVLVDAAAAAATRTLANALAEAHPGASIEVRMPPWSAVQIALGSGPRHTRGTPPNVVETSPLTFLRLATGRLTWAEALAGGEVSASGAHADLSPVLPLLR